MATRKKTPVASAQATVATQPRRPRKPNAPQPRAEPPTHAGAVTVLEAARQIGTTVRTIHRMLHDGRLSGVKPGGDKLGWRIPQVEVDRIVGAPGAHRA